MSVCVFYVEQFNLYNAFSSRRDRYQYRSRYRCSVTQALVCVCVQMLTFSVINIIVLAIEEYMY